MLLWVSVLLRLPADGAIEGSVCCEHSSCARGARSGQEAVSPPAARFSQEAPLFLPYSAPTPPLPTPAGPSADGVIKAVGVLNAAVQRMVTWALWLSPLGIGSLIAASILRACDLLGGWVGGWAGGWVGQGQGTRRMGGTGWQFCGASVALRAQTPHAAPRPCRLPRHPCHPSLPAPAGTLAALGLWVATVLAGLAIFAGLLLPALLWASTGRHPLATARAFASSLLMAFGSSSSAAALPQAMQVGWVRGRVCGAGREGCCLPSPSPCQRPLLPAGSTHTHV